MTQAPHSNESFTKVHFDFNYLPYLSNPYKQLNLLAVAIGLWMSQITRGFGISK